VYHALGDEQALSRTLQALVELAPAHEMARDIPPALRQRFDAMRARARVTPAPTDEAPDRDTGAAPAELEPHAAGSAPAEPEPVVAGPIATAPSPAETARTATVGSEPASHAALDDRSDGDGLGPWPFVAAAALVLAAGAAVAIYFLVPGSSTQPSFPRHPL
jgi:hypothetical protein